MVLGEKIKFHRNKLNLSQEDFGIKCNLSRNAIYNYENNKRTPTIEIILKIAEILDISVSDLLDNNDSVNTYANRLELLKSIDKDIENTIDVNDEKNNHYELEMNELYNKHFFDLFNWKTIKMKPHEYFKFILSLCPLNQIDNFTEEDLHELSILFYRFVTLKSHERNAINDKEKFVSSNTKQYEKNNFLTTNTK
jgi:transcriptional regulator with XRE-family HTH domain